MLIDFSRLFTGTNRFRIVVVGAATPGVAKWIFAIVCYIGAGVQVLGFIAVAKVSTPRFPQHAKAER
jgi:hypothetical protein